MASKPSRKLSVPVWRFLDIGNWQEGIGGTGEGLRGSTEGKKEVHPPIFCLVSWSWRQRRRSQSRRSAVDLRWWDWGDWIWGSSGRHEDLQVLCLTGWRGLWVPLECLLKLEGVWDRAGSGGRKVRRGRAVCPNGDGGREKVTTAGSVCRAGRETGGLDLEEP